MTTTYPGAKDNLPRPGPATEMDDAGFEGDLVIDNISDAIEAIETKLGIGSSVAAANQVLRGTGAGATGFGQVVNGDISASAGISLSKLQTITSGQIVREVSSGMIGAGLVINANVDPAAGIAITKLADVGANNVLRSSGSGNVAGKVVTGDIQADTISLRPGRALGSTNPANGPGGPFVFADPKVTLTTTATGDILVWVNGEFNDGAGGAIVAYAVRLDGGGWQYVGETAQPSSAGRYTISGFHIFQGVASGAHTVEMGETHNANTVTHYGGGRYMLAFALYR